MRRVSIPLLRAAARAHLILVGGGLALFLVLLALGYIR